MHYSNTTCMFNSHEMVTGSYTIVTMRFNLINPCVNCLKLYLSTYVVFNNL